MLLSRTLEDKLSSLYRSGKIVGGVYVGRGQEAFSAGASVFLKPKEGDIYAPLIRDMAGRLAFGEPLLDPVRTYLGSVEGPMRGRDGNVHRGRPGEGLVAMISHLGSATSVINGMLMAKRYRGVERNVGLTCIGDGGTSTGAFHEALNQAAVEKLPLVVAVADNQFAYSTHKSRQFACEHLVDRAKGYGVRGYRCDGTDLADCLATFEEAVGRARDGDGPQMVVGQLLRLSGHGEHDDAYYVPDEIKKSAVGRDCLEVSVQQLLAGEWATAAEIAEWRAEAQKAVDSAVAKVAKEPKPDGVTEDWCALSSKHLCEGAPEV